MHEWITRAVSGYWTHAGYMNWDSGLGFERWHQAKKFGLDAGGAGRPRLLGLAAARQAVGPRGRRRCSTTASTSTTRAGRALARRHRRPACSSTCTPCRRATSSARLGAGARRGQRRPRDRRRPRLEGVERAAAAVRVRPRHRPPRRDHADLQHRDRRRQPAARSRTAASTSRACSTAQQEVAANIGGRPPASFGLLVRDVGGRRVTASQLGRAARRAGRAPAAADQGAARRGRGVVAPRSAAPTPGRSATCARPAPLPTRELALRVTHRFTRDWIQTSWTATRRTGSARYTADVLFPSWRGATARRASSRSCATARG